MPSHLSSVEALLGFLVKIKTWVIFLALVVVSIAMLVRGNDYQQSVYLTSANSVATALHGGVNNVTGYLNLREANRQLTLSNASLENEVLNLRQQIADLRSCLPDSTDELQRRFDFVPAAVVSNSTRLPANYFTINKGRADGVEAGMGVVDHNGVVGIVNVAGPHTSRVISVLNVHQTLSVKLKNSDAIGTLTWKGSDPAVAYMEDVARHVKFKTGDTIVTSGASNTFPAGLLIGTVMNRVRGDDDNYFTLKVRLLPDFPRLEAVRVLKDSYQQELDSLRQFDIKEPDIK